PVLQTVRIPLSAFATDLSSVRGLRFVFNRTSNGAIHLAHIRAPRFSRLGAENGQARAAAPALAVPRSRYGALFSPPPSTLTQPSICSVSSNSEKYFVTLCAGPGERFPIQDAMPMLGIGERVFGLSQLDPQAATLTFALTAAEYRNIAGRSQVCRLQYGEQPPLACGVL